MVEYLTHIKRNIKEKPCPKILNEVFGYYPTAENIAFGVVFNINRL